MHFTLNTQSLLWLAFTAVAVIVFIVWAYRQVVAQLAGRTGWLLTCLRIGAVGLLLFTICEPAVSFAFRRTDKATVLLLVDTSDSISITDRLGNRAQAASRLLTGSWFKTLDDRYRVQPYRFAESVAPLTEREFDPVPVQKNGTDIGAALDFVKTRTDEEQVAGVILVTDGNPTVGRDPLRAAAGLGLPVYTIGIGDTTEPQDAAVVKHLTNDIAYANSKVPVEVTIRSNGFDGVRVPVTLSEGTRVIDTQYVTLSGGEREQSVMLHLVPTEDGAHQYTVTIPVQPREQIPQNNSYGFTIKVLKEKLGILYIEGSPRADVTFLKRTLERDPNVEVTSLIARPDGSFYPKPLPATRAEWFRYDLVILGSLPAARLQRWDRQIVEFVEQKGGGLIALGGHRSFELGGYAGTPLGSLMPVIIPAVNRGVLEGLFTPDLTPDGRDHPVTQLDDDPLRSARRWGELPPLPGINQVGPAKPGAIVLAVHPTWKAGGRNAPVIAVQRYGLGKVMAITAYDLWRWDLMMWGTGGTSVSYERFWNNIVRWLTTREGSQRVRVAAGKEHYRGGEPVDLTGQVYDESYHPLDGATVTVTVVPKTAGGQRAEVEFTPAGNGSGRYGTTVRGLPSGEYAFTARAVRDGRELGSDSGRFRVGELNVEYLRARMNQDLLVRLASMTGGRFYRVSEADRLLSEVRFPAPSIARTNEVQLWNHPAMLILFILLLSAEWFIRRQRGLM
ncbi:MAG: hypothetical protein HY710_00030 [Candidatus Latescibacteria bacterium]|nr:hypothetical protein [Candidatus Latescibacterota bacterium]